MIKKNPDGTETVIEKKTKAKKPPAMPKVFKAGKWNPETVLVEEEIEKCGESRSPQYNCCKMCNLRNLHRAVENDDAPLLKQLVMDTKNIAVVIAGWSPSNKQSILAKIVDMHNFDVRTRCSTLLCNARLLFMRVFAVYCSYDAVFMVHH